MSNDIWGHSTSTHQPATCINCTSTEVFVQQDAVHTEPAAWVTELQQTFLSNKTNFTKNLCLDLPVHECLSKKRQFTKNHLSGLYLPVHERCPTTGGSPRTTKACLCLPVHERLSNKRQFSKNHQSVSGPTCARTTKEPLKRVWTHLCTSVCPTRGSSAETIKACLYLPMHESLSNKGSSPRTTQACLYLPVHERLSNKRQFTKKPPKRVWTCPTRGSSARTTKACLDLPVHERLSNKRQFTKKPPKRVWTYLCTSVCPTRGSSARTTKACLDLPVHERLSNKRQFTKNHQSVSGPTCARASVQQEAIANKKQQWVSRHLNLSFCPKRGSSLKKTPKRVCTHLCTSVCPTRGSSPRTTQACLDLPMHERLSGAREKPAKHWHTARPRSLTHLCSQPPLRSLQGFSSEA